ncbi:uncharacterized protein LOC122244382, partial [Penaeus japonicus]|uniref:uncharacterized protein LOC122244382 n=1 Tax=Penaeus japonicus TaxID=27405 RepID=UPI001C70D453
MTTCKLIELRAILRAFTPTNLRLPQVKCELTSVAHHNDGGWTLVLDQEAGIDILSNLSLWSWHPNNTERPLVMQVRMQTVDGEEIHATYDNVVIDRNTDTFMSVGEYHGTAGDALVPGQNFVNCDPGTCQAVAFTGNAPFWGDYFLEAKTKIFFRPKDYDEPRSCPPLDLHGEGADIPLSRSPGAVVTFWCRHWLMREGPAGGPRVDRGTVTCVNDTSAERPQWDRELALPCTIECPSDFVLANNGTACFHFSSSPVAFGIVEASRKCSVKNASLAIVKDPTDLSHL